MKMTVKKTFGRILPVAAVFVFCLTILAARCEGCFSIVVGKEASVDGYVIIAHNEDDFPPQIVNHHKIPRKKHSPGEKVKLLNGGRLAQAEQTWAYIWSEMPGMLFSDSYINEWGVSVTSDNCPSREDKPQITNGGIGYMLRHLVAERAKTAREGVLLAGSLVERFGYIDSGRTYIICDPDEGWLFCVVNGKHWLAQRVGNDQVAMVANTYTVHQVDLSDRDNFLASKISSNMPFRGAGTIQKRTGRSTLLLFIQIPTPPQVFPTSADSGAALDMLLPNQFRPVRSCPFRSYRDAR